MFWQLCLENDKQSRSAPSTQYHQYDKHSICTQGQIKKNQFKTRRQFHYLHNGKLLFFKLGFFFSHVSNEEKLIVTIKQKKDVKLPIQALLL